ncbi:hypothetical protein LTR97_006227 [Elasticomyces elasticus]|uniref:Protein kinase domain-containing protein n=1 Tax=Elasticomyces elasticus TaxID=574655 RepID=A0AAN7VSU9_9PEZI|nr:hypothetical protein LTR97_006227 [Elasticomyces elasticus]
MGFLERLQENRINGRFTLIRKLAEGGGGDVYYGADCEQVPTILTPADVQLGRDHELEQDVAVKLEHRHNHLLRDEGIWLATFEGLPGFPTILWSGYHDEVGFLILNLLGPSLEDLFEYCECQFSLKTTIMLADQLIARLKTVHSENKLHRDVKPGNFLMGTGEDGNTVYITDFATATGYRPGSPLDDGEDLTQSDRGLIGTTWFASIRGHTGQSQAPADDLEALGYMLIYFVQGTLPWLELEACNITEKDQDQVVMEMKMTLSVDELCSGLPTTFAEYMTTVKRLKGCETPPYDELRELFKSLAREEGMEYDNVFDWTERMHRQQLALEDSLLNGAMRSEE